MPDHRVAKSEVRSINATEQQTQPADTPSEATSAEARRVPVKGQHACARVATGHRRPRTEAAR
jgi:hypothetical protein